MASKPRIVLGTHNRKKRGELEQLLAPLGFALCTLADFPDAVEVVEDGETFAANAVLKATRQAVHLREWVLADDSGLVVDALGGEPGVRSARYSGPGATDASNNRLLLERLGDRPPDQRTARFVCRMALADPAGEIRAESEGTCRGRILFEPRGSHGFGYDPLFEVVEYHRPFAAMSPTVKAHLSHRARAAERMAAEIEALLAAGEHFRSGRTD